MTSRYYRSFEEFAREEIRPHTRAGWSLDELDIETGLNAEEFVFDDEDSDDEDEDYG